MASLVTVNDRDVSQMRLCIPRVGPWSADLVVDSEDALTGDVTIGVNDELELHGSVRRGGIGPTLENTLRVVAGKGGLTKTAQARFYENGVQARTVIGDLLGDAGEALSSESSQSLLSTGLGIWTTIAHPVGRALQVLMAAIGGDAVYRVLPDGSVFFGVDSFADFTGDADALDLQEFQGRMIVGQLAPTLLPGVMLEGKKISYVEHVLTGDGSSTVAWYD